MQQAKRVYDAVAQKDRRDRLIVEHLTLVRHLVGKLAAELPPGVDMENLESAGVLGLVEAAHRFDPERGIQFKTYAYTRIRGAVLDELRRNCPLPQHMLQQVARVRQAYEELPPPVTTDALTAATGLSENEVADCLAALRMTRLLSWEEHGEPIGTRLDDPRRPDLLAEKEEQKRLLVEALAALDERERLIVTLYYLEDLRLKEIGEVLRLSESRVSRLLNAALFHLGEYMRTHGG
ncbi:MAG TPA: sigma-70 family RNA polymerase sigma factor [Gemmataceae bacterium]|nr:sigma-70 family RNA polymerase sigma factor [Gemmataceae bacterium]